VIGKLVGSVIGHGQDLWVFGYGSLMWRPGFAFEERGAARLLGYHRALCVYSHVHRGTPDRPGLVMGLDRGGSCIGLAFRVLARHVPETLAYLREREQVTMVYRERLAPVRLQDGRAVLALTYTVDRRHPQYAGRLDLGDLVRFVQQGEGKSGLNRDYVLSTHEALAAIGVTDPSLARLAQALTSPHPGP
jgi:cation transport protein ChaC